MGAVGGARRGRRRVRRGLGRFDGQEITRGLDGVALGDAGVLEHVDELPYAFPVARGLDAQRPQLGGRIAADHRTPEQALGVGAQLDTTLMEIFVGGDARFPAGRVERGAGVDELALSRRSRLGRTATAGDRHEERRIRVDTRVGERDLLRVDGGFVLGDGFDAGPALRFEQARFGLDDITVPAIDLLTRLTP